MNQNLLDIAYEKEENILFINDMINSDTRNNIVNKSFFKKSYEKKKRFIHLFSKSLIKNTEKYSLKKKNRKSIINNRKSLALIRESDEIEFINRKSILSSQKILIDNITEKYATRKKTSKIKKKFCRDIQISNNLFSSTNQEITKLKTQMIKASFLKTIEEKNKKISDLQTKIAGVEKKIATLKNILKIDVGEQLYLQDLLKDKKNLDNENNL